jgi:oxalate decarboxylase
MTILSPDGLNSLDTYKLKPSDVYFVPRAYPNHIENIGQTEVIILVFFDQPISGGIGYTDSFSAYSREVLASTLQCSPTRLPQCSILSTRFTPCQPY